MSNIYNLAHELSKELKNSQEYKDFISWKEEVEKDPANKKMLDDFRKKAFDAQLKQLSGEEFTKEETEELQALEEIVRLNPTISEYLVREYYFSKMIEDVNKIVFGFIEVE